MDRIDKAARSRIMRSVRAKGSRIEREFVDALKSAGLNDFVMHPSDIPGKPDVIFPRQKLAIFIDSCFWHGCPQHLRMPKSNTEYWEWKIHYNRERDREQTKELVDKGWRVIRLWEHELEGESYIAKIREATGSMT